MKCPQCKSWAEVLETRAKKDGSKRRTYQCANLHKFMSVETLIGLSLPVTKTEKYLSTRRRRVSLDAQQT